MLPCTKKWNARPPVETASLAMNGAGLNFTVRLWREVSIQTFPLLGRLLSHSIDPFANLVFETKTESTVSLSYMYMSQYVPNCPT